MSEFQSDIKDRQYDEEGNELDKHGFRIKRYSWAMDLNIKKDLVDGSL